MSSYSHLIDGKEYLLKCLSRGYERGQQPLPFNRELAWDGEHGIVNCWMFVTAFRGGAEPKRTVQQRHDKAEKLAGDIQQVQKQLDALLRERDVSEADKTGVLGGFAAEMASAWIKLYLRPRIDEEGRPEWPHPDDHFEPELRRLIDGLVIIEAAAREIVRYTTRKPGGQPHAKLRRHHIDALAQTYAAATWDDATTTKGGPFLDFVTGMCWASDIPLKERGIEKAVELWQKRARQSVR